MTCYITETEDGVTMFLCGDFGPHCTECSDVGDEFLCDYPVAEGKTCDKGLCGKHAHEVAPNVHYCPGHFALWEEFRKAGGVTKELENIVPFRAAAAIGKQGE